MLSWTDSKLSRDEVDRLFEETVGEGAVIGELQLELRNAEVEANLLLEGDTGARDELPGIMLVLQRDFVQAADFDADSERQIVGRAEESWHAAEMIASSWLSSSPGQFDVSQHGEFHALIDAASGELLALDVASREELAADVADYHERSSRNDQRLLLVLAAAVLVTAWVARRLRLAAYRPLRQLESSLDRVSGNGQRVRVEITGDREFHAVADSLNDMSDRLQNTVDELEHQAFHDSLTGLPNRARLEQRLSAVLADADILSVGVLILDLDGFKAINDGLGHPAGDTVLIAVARRLQQSVRPTDIVGRLGGDEFAVVVTDTSASDIDALSTRLTAAFEQPIVVDGRSLLVEASAGAALARPGDVPADLFRHADIALYSAKDAGKARLHLFEPQMLADVEQRLATESDLRAGIEAGQIEVHYQPITDVQTGTVAGVEALARWNHPTRGLLGPVSFISLAEVTGLIEPLGRVVLDAACAQVAAWQHHPGLEQLSLSVNVSARQLRSADIVDHARAALANSGLAPGSLVLEVTESITADTNAVAMLHELRTLGIRIALDDFGTGYSSLSYLQRLPIDVLKIDKIFVDDLHTQADSAALAGAIIRLGRSFGLKIVAEGVEKPEQLRLLKQLGCDLAQGYLIARPAPPDIIAATLLALAPTQPNRPTGPPSNHVDTVTVRVGPLASSSAQAWLTNASANLDRVRTSTSKQFGIPPGVLATIDSYVARWTDIACTSDTFLWTGDEDPAILRAITQRWFQLAELLTQEAAANGRTDAPPAGQPFQDALISSILVALAVAGDHDLQAEAIAWQRSWPHTLTDQTEASPVFA